MPVLRNLERDELAEIHERYADWWSVRDRYDPEGRFLNTFLEGLRPAG